MNVSMSSRLLKLNRVIFILSIIGIIIAIYVLQGFIRQSPIVCVNTGCELVRKNPASYIFGIPVPAVGLIGYTALAILAFLRSTVQKSWHLTAMLGIGIFGVSFVTWFTYTEIFVIKGICTWCAISAINMVVILLLVATSISFHKQQTNI
jgi:uncharacterized membrane protein